MTHDGSELLMGVGRDIEKLLGQAPGATVRIAEHGWLGLSGEAACADLNMAMVTRRGSASLVESYVGEIRDRGLDAILLVEQDAPDLDASAEGLGLAKVGAVPVMVWRDQPAPTPSRSYHVRLAVADDVPMINALVAATFSIEEEKVQRVMPPSVVRSGVDVWIVEDDGEAVGTATFVRRDDHVGVYNMATPEKVQRRGIGRAVLDAAIAHYLERGASTFTLEATPAGVHLYEQVGFVTVATPSAFVTAASMQFPG